MVQSIQEKPTSWSKESNITGDEIEGMHALRDAANEAWEILQSEVSTGSSRFIRSV